MYRATPLLALGKTHSIVAVDVLILAQMGSDKRRERMKSKNLIQDSFFCVLLEQHKSHSPDILLLGIFLTAKLKRLLDG